MFKKKIIYHSLHLQKLLECLKVFVNNYCTGKREPTLDVLILICKALNESADYMLGLSD